MAEFGWTGLCPTIGLSKVLGQARSLDNEVKFQLLKVTPGKPGPGPDRQSSHRHNPQQQKHQ